MADDDWLNQLTTATSYIAEQIYIKSWCWNYIIIDNVGEKEEDDIQILTNFHRSSQAN